MHVGRLNALELQAVIHWLSGQRGSP
jgi:hypothetical protein